MPTNILNLSSYTVTALQESDHDYHIDAVAKDSPEHCPHCQSDNLVAISIMKYGYPKKYIFPLIGMNND